MTVNVYEKRLYRLLFQSQQFSIFSSELELSYSYASCVCPIRKFSEIEVRVTICVDEQINKEDSKKVKEKSTLDLEGRIILSSFANIFCIDFRHHRKYFDSKLHKYYVSKRNRTSLAAVTSTKWSLDQMWF